MCSVFNAFQNLVQKNELCIVGIVVSDSIRFYRCC